MNRLTVAGQVIELHKLSQSDENGLWFALLSTFELYKFGFNGTDMLLLVPIGNNDYSPAQLRKIADRISIAKNCTAVFYFASLPTLERDRLVGQGVYFIVGDKFAMLPTLLMNRIIGKRNYGERLRPASQYIFLYHLQRGDIEGKSFKELEEITPYKYATIANSIKQLEELGLLETALDENRVKRILITKSSEALWNAANKVLVNPVSNVVYTSQPISGAIAGISALSEYSMLAPEKVPTKVVTQSQFKELVASGLNTYSTEDIQRIEVWSYPPIIQNGVVDRLSLALSLKDDHDPRVEKEIESMMKQLW